MYVFIFIFTTPGYAVCVFLSNKNLSTTCHLLIKKNYVNGKNLIFPQEIEGEP